MKISNQAGTNNSKIPDFHRILIKYPDLNFI